MKNNEEFYLRLSRKELLFLRRLLRGVIRGESFTKAETQQRQSDRDVLLELYESLLGARDNLSSSREIDAAVKKTEIYTALSERGYFDYEEDNNDSTFYDLVCFLDTGGWEVFEEIAEEFKKREAARKEKNV